jgi:hypothetical protein
MSTQKPPPASTRFIQNLSQKLVTKDDLLDENNGECIICYETHNIGAKATKLACGHLFCKSCIVGWLVTQATCPTCRYEVETDDIIFESGRKRRMQDRKIRCRKDELNSKSVRELREILDFFSIGYVDCFDKTSMIDKLISSGNVVITERVPDIEISR